ncbi:hypothetical protein D3C74_494840 [compost metagenome]
MPSTVETREPTKPWDVLRFVLYSGIGIAVFFVPVTLNGKSTIALDHIVSWVREAIGAGVP